MEIPGRMDAENKFARRIGELTGKQYKRLKKLLGKPPNPANVPESFWEEVKKETEDEIAIALLLLFSASSHFHAEGRSKKSLSTELMGRLETEALTYSDRRSKELADSYTQTSRDIFDTLSRDIEEGGVKTSKELADRTASVFGPDRAAGIAVTETTAAQSAGGEAGTRATVGLSPKDLWITSKDQRVCPICRPLHRTPRSFWGPKYVDGPPAHPNCRCVIKYEKSGLIG